jgi:hypothetical protein
MMTVLLLAHLLGDYVFQCNKLALWKARSIWGVLAHGGIVTATTLACAALTAPAWWPYALLIGLIHILIDVGRAQFLRTSDTAWELTWYLLDQLAHLSVIGGVFHLARKSGAPAMTTGAARALADPRILFYVLGYLALLNPAWVLIRLVVRGVWGPRAAPHLGGGEKVGPMVERVSIATCILLGQFFLVPLVLLPRRVVSIQFNGNGAGVMVALTSHWAETALSVFLATGIGVALRIVSSI